MNEFNLRGKNCLITGGARGLGREIAQTFGRYGGNIIILDISEEGIEELKESFSKDFNREVSFFKTDLSSEKSILNAKKNIINIYKNIDVIVNNAGVIVVKDFFEHTLEDLEYMIKVNAFGPFMICKYFTSSMIQKKYGKIINIGSIDAIVGRTGHKTEIGVTNDVGYCLTKGAILSFTRALAVALGKYNINVNAICPILLRTPMTEFLFRDEKKVSTYKKIVPLGKLPTTTDVSLAALFLASSGSDSITGEILNIDAGYLGSE